MARVSPDLALSDSDSDVIVIREEVDVNSLPFRRFRSAPGRRRAFWQLSVIFGGCFIYLGSVLISLGFYADGLSKPDNFKMAGYVILPFGLCWFVFFMFLSEFSYYVCASLDKSKTNYVMERFDDYLRRPLTPSSKRTGSISSIQSDFSIPSTTRGLSGTDSGRDSASSRNSSTKTGNTSSTATAKKVFPKVHNKVAPMYKQDEFQPPGYADVNVEELA